MNAECDRTVFLAEESVPHNQTGTRQLLLLCLGLYLLGLLFSHDLIFRKANHIANFLVLPSRKRQLL